MYVVICRRLSDEAVQIVGPFSEPEGAKAYCKKHNRKGIWAYEAAPLLHQGEWRL